MHTEQKLALKIKKWMGVINARKRDSILLFLCAKIATLKQSYTELEQKARLLDSSTLDLANTESGSGNLASRVGYQHVIRGNKHEIDVVDCENKRITLLKEIKAARSLRDTEAQTDRALEFQVAKAWDEMKRMRVLAGYNSTLGRLAVRAKRVKKEVNRLN